MELDFTKRIISCIWMFGQPKELDGGNEKFPKGAWHFWEIFGERR